MNKNAASIAQWMKMQEMRKVQSFRRTLISSSILCKFCTHLNLCSGLLGWKGIGYEYLPYSSIPQASSSAFQVPQRCLTSLPGRHSSQTSPYSMHDHQFCITQRRARAHPHSGASDSGGKYRLLESEE